jgi:type VI secretion system secreted protein VgrG
MIEKTDETGRPCINICSHNGDIILSAPNGRIHFRSKFYSREVG